jgi:hypothetical protein
MIRTLTLSPPIFSTKKACGGTLTIISSRPEAADGLTAIPADIKITAITGRKRGSEDAKMRRCDLIIKVPFPASVILGLQKCPEAPWPRVRIVLITRNAKS